MPDIERRTSAREILDRLSALEAGQRSIQLELVGLKELYGSDIRAYEMFKKLLVSIDSDLHYDHDTVFMTNDEERGYIRSLMHREARDELASALAVERHDWWNKRWGRWSIYAGVAFGVLTLIVNAVQALNGFHR